MARIITIAQQKGGSGKTTLAAHLAVALRQAYDRVAIIDTDPQASLATWYRYREMCLGKDATGLMFKALKGWKIENEITRLEDHIDWIVIDSTPHAEMEAKCVIRAADLVLIPMQPTPTDFWATQATVDACINAKVPYAILLNRVHAKAKYIATLEHETSKFLETRLGNRVLFASALSEGRTANEVSPKSQASEEINTLLDEVLAHMNVA